MNLLEFDSEKFSSLISADVSMEGQRHGAYLFNSKAEWFIFGAFLFLFFLNQPSGMIL